MIYECCYSVHLWIYVIGDVLHERIRLQQCLLLAPCIILSTLQHIRTISLALTSVPPYSSVLHPYPMDVRTYVVLYVRSICIYACYQSLISIPFQDLTFVTIQLLHQHANSPCLFRCQKTAWFYESCQTSTSAPVICDTLCWPLDYKINTCL